MGLEPKQDEEPAQQVLFPDLITSYREGRDELNLAEFPISAIGTRLDPSVKTILFQDAAFDKSTGETITRKLTITASDQYGLPTAPDDEILLGLLQLSRIQNFSIDDCGQDDYSGWRPDPALAILINVVQSGCCRSVLN